MSRVEYWLSNLQYKQPNSLKGIAFKALYNNSDQLQRNRYLENIVIPIFVKATYSGRCALFYCTENNWHEHCICTTDKFLWINDSYSPQYITLYNFKHEQFDLQRYKSNKLYELERRKRHLKRIAELVGDPVWAENLDARFGAIRRRLF